MKLYKCLWQTIDLEHVLAVSDYEEANHQHGFAVTLALRDAPLFFFKFQYEVKPEVLQQGREDLLSAWKTYQEETYAKIS